MAAQFRCLVCSAWGDVFVTQTIEEIDAHRRSWHDHTRLVDCYVVESRPNLRGELYLAHCSRCAAEIRSTTPDPRPVPICGWCEEKLREGLEFRAQKADAAVVNPTRSDPKETNMSNHLTIKLTGLTASQAGTAADLGFDATKSTATFTGDPAVILAAIRKASADLKAAKKAAGERVGNAPHIDALARKYEMAVENKVAENLNRDRAAEIAQGVQDRLDAGETLVAIAAAQTPPVTVTPAAAEVIVALAAEIEAVATVTDITPVPRGERIPADVDTFVCRGCGAELPVKKFPTISGPTERATTCRGCRDAGKGAPRAPKAPRAPRTPKAPATPKGLDPATAPYGIGGQTAAEVDRTFKAAWVFATEADGTVPADAADRLREAHKQAHTAIVTRSARKAS